MSTNIVLSPEVIAVLERAEIQGNSLKIVGQLDRKLYVAVNKALECLGGKWNTKAKAHLFEDDPGTLIEEALASGAVVDAVKKFQFYPTPAEVASRMVVLADLGELDKAATVLEPSAGNGGILNQIYVDVNVEVCELNEAHHEALAKLPGVKIVGTDFLSFEPGYLYDRIIANPPFTAGQDVAHAMKMLDLLKPGGKLVCILGAGVLFRQDKKTQALHARLVAECPSYHIEELGEGAFKASGTMVRAVLLIAEKQNEAKVRRRAA